MYMQQVAWNKITITLYRYACYIAFLIEHKHKYTKYGT